MRTVTGHAIEDAQIGRMRHAQGEVSVRIEGTSNRPVVVTGDVWIVHTTNIDLSTVGLEDIAGIGQV